MRNRNLQSELMDDPAIDPDVHRAALRGLARVNTISDAATPIARAIRKRLLDVDIVPERLSVLDVATGSGDLPIRLARLLETPGCALEFHACDISRTALETTRERSERAGVPISTHAVDILADPLPEADVVTCALFMHHLTEEQAVRALVAMSRAARRLLVISDLRRSWPALVMVAAATRLVTRSRVVHVDAVRSVQGSFTSPELAHLADRAGLVTASIRPIRPARMLLCWQADDE